MLKKRLIPVLALAAVLMPKAAFAITYVTCYNVAITDIIPGNAATDTAHIVDIGPCNILPNGNRVYIDFDDKEMFAEVLAAKLNGLNIFLNVDTSATSKGSATAGVISQKALAVWFY